MNIGVNVTIYTIFVLCLDTSEGWSPYVTVTVKVTVTVEITDLTTSRGPLHTKLVCCMNQYFVSKLNDIGSTVSDNI